ncbi:MAG: dienelactone hydrolase family protein [Alphaproteobacteria bacterium]|nr:dienelactone hydrolase family protein [Alphaproteobacteria bacterium]
MAEVTITAGDGGTFSAYLASPATGSGPGIVVIQEIFGINKVMRDIADGWAALGYMAICPDLFWRQEPGIQLTDQSQAEWDRAFELYQGFDEAKGAEDLGATLAHLRGLGECTGKIGSVGFCLGGKLAYLMATRTDTDCNVGYYGVGIENALDEAANIKAPLLLHIAEKDQFCPPEAQAKVHGALDAYGQVTIHDYTGVDHAFARTGGEHYDKTAADLANQRTADFFDDNLKS